jgi:hypothetical protein
MSAKRSQSTRTQNKITFVQKYPMIIADDAVGGRCSTMRRVGFEIPKKIENFEKSFQLSDVTDILTRIESGDGHAADELLPIVYDELRRLASQRLAREAAGNSLQTTELVHEAYLRLVQTEQHWEGNAHFFAAAAESMRRILVDRARARKRRKRGGDLRRSLANCVCASRGW